jgi:hypothetical protein
MKSILLNEIDDPRLAATAVIPVSTAGPGTMLCDGLSRTIDASVLACRRSGTRYRTTKFSSLPESISPTDWLQGSARKNYSGTSRWIAKGLKA